MLKLILNKKPREDNRYEKTLRLQMGDGCPLYSYGNDNSFLQNSYLNLIGLCKVGIHKFNCIFLNIYDIENEDQVRHRVFLVSEESLIKEIEEQFSQIDRIYIADGHHRCASAVKVGLKRRQEDKEGKEINAEYNYFLSVLSIYFIKH